MCALNTSIGLVPDGGWTLLVPLLIGFARAQELVYLDPVLTSAEALRVGLVTQVVDDARLVAATQELAMRLATGPSRAFAIAKETFNHAWLSSLEHQLEVERRGIIQAAGTADARAGIAAFMAKTRPAFVGR